MLPLTTRRKWPTAGDKVEITGKENRGAQGIVAGLTMYRPADIWLFIRLDKEQTIKARPEDLTILKHGGQSARQIAEKASSLRMTKYYSRDYRERYNAAERLEFLDYLLSVLARHM